MENNPLPIVSVGDFVAYLNQTLELAYPSINIEGEVESFKVNQGKYVFFNIKDAEASVSCFMMVFSLRVPIEDGMRVVIRARPKLTKWGKFSVTVESIRPSGEGSIKKSFELLKQKLEKEGLFADERKRLLPHWPKKVGVISSVESAGYADFMKIANDRLGGVEFIVHHVQVQGEAAPEQIVKALGRINQMDEPPEVAVLVRGGGSADDLAAFNDEALVRAVAASRVPTLVGVGHEVDVTLCDLVADVRAATPSNAAQILLPDKEAVQRRIVDLRQQLLPRMRHVLEERRSYVLELMASARAATLSSIEMQQESVLGYQRLLLSYDPKRVLARGYAIVRGECTVGELLEIETRAEKIIAEVKTYERK
jgi:exodeoxyribonuclease VII large subunit